MTEQPTSIAPFYKGWDVYQSLLINALAPLSPEQLALRAAPHQWSIGILAAHVIAARVGWFHIRMGEGSADLTPLADWDDDGAPARSAAELVAGLEASWQMIQDALARWTYADLEQVFPHPSRPDRPARSRQWIIWHVIEHDLHHGGEISLSLGIYGLAAPDL
ncbi:MAG TPA: DinB family protein [Ktedonosporobacter sp.]|nr:DinB family protein [Ktedonosporobacter sp.]